MKFTWSDKEDDELYKNGITIMWMAGRTKAIQRFIEALSYRIGHKCVFSFAVGRAHIDVPKEGYDKAFEAVCDVGFMDQFIVPYSEESYENETYCEVIG